MAHQIKNSFKLALAQLNPVVGDLAGNTKKAREVRARVAAARADLVVFTELYLTGYPLEDMVLKPALQKAAREAAEGLARDTADGGPAVLAGLPWGDAPFVYNAVALLDRGRIEAVRYKNNLPNYGVFDEKRVFATGPMPAPIDWRGAKLGVPVCEDIWSAEVCKALAERGAGLLIVPNGSPYWMDKQEARYSVAETRVAETGLPLVYANQVGGQDELVFDGASFVLNGDCTLALQLPAWEEVLGITEWRREKGRWHCVPGEIAAVEEGEAANYLACVTGLRDYVGAFAVTAGLGSAEKAAQFKAELDDYSAILLESLGDRLAEAFAERLHERVRTEFWGYQRDEDFDNEALLKERYVGIRPAPGYPACPEHTEKQTLWELLDVKANVGIELTESMAMWPGASVCGVYFSHPQSQYFVVGRLGRDQVEDYARRKGWTTAEAEKWLAPNLGYRTDDE